MDVGINPLHMKILTHALTLEQTYRLMTGIVVPRPSAWITTAHLGQVITQPAIHQTEKALLTDDE